MAIALITGAAGLVGSEAARYFAGRGHDVVGIDNDMRRTFFGDDASTLANRRRLVSELANYRHIDLDVRDQRGIDELFVKYARDITVIIHTAAQPSHDWAARDPHTDFTVNAMATLNLLQATRKYCPHAAFIFTSTNKVYGDTPNRLPLVEGETRYEPDPSHRFAEHGIDETMSVDQTLHTPFGCSKLAADVMVQEFGRNFGINTVCFRGGCLTGPCHAGTQLHGFLSYLARCAVTDKPYTIFGYHGKQVRDNIHAHDLVNMFWHYYRNPRPGEVYNAGGSRHANCSVLEAIKLCESITGKPMNVTIDDQARTGDHIWWISDTRKFQSHYPQWRYEFNLEQTLRQIIDNLTQSRKG